MLLKPLGYLKNQFILLLLFKFIFLVIILAIFAFIFPLTITDIYPLNTGTDSWLIMNPSMFCRLPTTYSKIVILKEGFQFQV